MAWHGNHEWYPSSGWAPTSDFRYEPIRRDREIRLLKFRPGATNPAGILFCEMEHTLLDHRPNYQALSYSWRAAAESGGYRTNASIICNRQRLALTGGLLDALRRFAVHTHETTWFWVDSLCINQSDNDEKARQIELMKDIYRDARLTVIWLGDARDNSNSIQLAFDFLRFIYQSLGHLRERSEFEYAIPRLVHTGQLSLQVSMGALSSLLSREWFGRVWVLQEAVISSEAVVHCGQSYVRWREFCCALRTLRDSGLMGSIFNMFQISGAAPQVRMSRVNQFLLLYQQYHEQGFQFSEDHRPPLNELKSLMQVSRWMDSTDLRDKVYAVLGLSDDDYGISIDYSQSWTTAGLYRDVAIRFLSKDDGFCNCTFPNCPWSPLSVLADISLDQPVRSPSWVPNWTAPQIGSLWYRSITAGYRAAGTTRPNVTVLDDEDLLRITGRLCDRVVFVSDVCPRHDYQNVQMTANTVNPFAPAESLNAQRLVPINRWITQASQLAQQCQRYQPFWREAFWRTICANTTVRHVISTQTTNPSFPLPVDQSYGVYFDTFTRYISTLEVLLAQNAPPIAIRLALAPIDYDFNTFLIAFSYAAPTRRFFTTQSGYMGLGPQNTQAGDRVCIFDGGPVPMVLRPVATPVSSSSSHIFPRGQQQQERLLLIGECYVHGLMSGEAVAPGSQLQRREIVLK